MIKLVLNTPDIFTGGTSVVKTFELTPKDYQGKTIKEVFAENAFKKSLEGQEPEAAKQALQLVFTLIQPVDVEKVFEWWDQSFESLINSSNEVILNMEFSKAGLEFINNVK
ncbi:MAG: hypothetical protein ACTSQK_08710 [Candidatus Heimdallarchaeota archaeon]